jgi:hypothetical protein
MSMNGTATLDAVADEEVLPSDNIYVRELMDVLLKEATRIANKSSEHSVQDLLSAAGFYVVGELPRLQTRKPNAWNLYLRHEKENAPEEVRKQTDDVTYNKSRPGVKGDYQRYMKERWDKEPDLRKKYERMAKGPSPVAVNEVDDQDNMDGDPIATLDEQIEDLEPEVELKPMKEVQKKSLKTLKKLVSHTLEYASLHYANITILAGCA